MSEPVLCYVERNIAYFTTAPLPEQWGDDWNDAPYEHNAGEPYEWADYRKVPRYEIIRVAFDGPFATPVELPGVNCNSPWSVEQINAQHVPWLTPHYGAGPAIMAGTTVDEFKRLVLANDGRVFVEQPKPESPGE